MKSGTLLIEVFFFWTFGLFKNIAFICNEMKTFFKRLAWLPEGKFPKSFTLKLNRVNKNVFNFYHLHLDSIFCQIEGQSSIQSSFIDKVLMYCIVFRTVDKGLTPSAVY